ncbi:MAG: hypothetical protein IAG13_37470 [Deltaproteobacteria bacterium]|nr:hypothetical protein [Nannocystaceae bacterium]
MRRSWHEPGELGRWLRRGSEALAVRVPVLAQLLAGHADPSTTIDLPIDGPEVELEMRRFADARTRLDARLLLVRATAEQTPTWMTLARDYGWAGRAARVDVHDIAADHLGVLRAPHVASLARALYDVG